MDAFSIWVVDERDDVMGAQRLEITQSRNSSHIDMHFQINPTDARDSKELYLGDMKSLFLHSNWQHMFIIYINKIKSDVLHSKLKSKQFLISKKKLMNSNWQHILFIINKLKVINRILTKKGNTFIFKF